MRHFQEFAAHPAEVGPGSPAGAPGSASAGRWRPGRGPGGPRGRAPARRSSLARPVSGWSCASVTCPSVTQTTGSGPAPARQGEAQAPGRRRRCPRCPPAIAMRDGAAVGQDPAVRRRADVPGPMAVAHDEGVGRARQQRARGRRAPGPSSPTGRSRRPRRRARRAGEGAAPRVGEEAPGVAQVGAGRRGPPGAPQPRRRPRHEGGLGERPGPRTARSPAGARRPRAARANAASSARPEGTRAAIAAVATRASVTLCRYPRGRRPRPARSRRADRSARPSPRGRACAPREARPPTAR